MLDKNYKVIEANLIDKLMTSEKELRQVKRKIDMVIQEIGYFKSEIVDENNLPMIYNKKQLDNYTNKLEILETMLLKAIIPRQFKSQN